MADDVAPYLDRRRVEALLEASVEPDRAEAATLMAAMRLSHWLSERILNPSTRLTKDIGGGTKSVYDHHAEGGISGNHHWPWEPPRKAKIDRSDGSRDGAPTGSPGGRNAMSRSSLKLAALLAFASAVAAPAAAQPHDADQGSLRREWEANNRRPKPVPAIPANLRATVSAPNAEWLIVRMHDGSQHRFGIGGITPENLESFAGGRFIGFSYSGHEESGYILIDRQGRGETAEILTGQRPAFSENGNHFAAAEYSESGFGNLNGVTLWQVMPNLRRLFFTDILSEGYDWRVDEFRGSRCVLVSALPQSAATDASVERERQYYALRFDEGIYFARAQDNACFDDSSGG